MDRFDHDRGRDYLRRAFDHRAIGAARVLDHYRGNHVFGRDFGGNTTVSRQLIRINDHLRADGAKLDHHIKPIHINIWKGDGMRQIGFSRIGPIAIIAGLLGSLAVGATVHNGQNIAPRAVFLALPETQPEPTVKLSVYQDHARNWLLQIDTTDFQFTELCVANAAATAIGHAHVVLNGQKVASAFHPIVNLGKLPAGQHRIGISLRGQDHRVLLGQNGIIGEKMDINVTATSLPLTNE